jgi:hypothetical protein
MAMRAFFALCFAVMLSFLFLPEISHKIQEKSGTSDKMINQPVTAEEKKEQAVEEVPEFNEGIAKANASLFMEALKQEIDDDYRVVNFSTKQDLISHLKKFVSEEIAIYYTEGLFEEKDSSLYIIPTELPPWLEEDQSVEIKQLTETSYRVYQKNQSDLYGTYNITLGFEYIDGKWLITFASVD